MKEKMKILIADDERSTREALNRYLSRSFEVTLAEDGIIALNLLKRHTYDFVLTDLRMPGADGMEVLKTALKHKPQPICIVFSAYGTIESAVEALKLGAFDFVEKPVNLDHLKMVMSRGEESLMLRQENQQLKAQLSGKNDPPKMVAAAAKMQEIVQLIKQIAPSRSTVLITGESGTGKEVVASMIHTESHRSGPFVAVHCAALPATLLESELFGHERGAFTGAIEQKKGRFELASNGTLFLDEIGEIDPQIQVKLLRVLESRTIERIGGGEPIHCDVRLIAATNRDLREMVRTGKFREDLFYRLDVVNVHLPPLRERKEDIPLLIKRFIDHFSAENSKPISGISPEALELMLNYSWPGNIRELRNMVERMVVLCRGSELTATDLPPSLHAANITDFPAVQNLNATIPENEKALIIKILNECKDNRSLAAKRLGISRRTLYRRLKEYDLC